MKDKKKIVSIVTLIIGVIMLIVGVVFLIIRLNSSPSISDAEYLVKVGSWEMEPSKCPESEELPENCGEASVIWTFTEVGKGALTTNGHENDYDFIWAIEDGKLLIETDWLYIMDNEFSYQLDQGSKILTLTPTDSDESSGSVNFYPASSVDT